MLRQMIVTLGLKRDYDLNKNKSKFMLQLHEIVACFIVCTIEMINCCTLQRSI